MVSDIIEGFVVGILAALVILYGLSPKTAYPSWMMTVFHHPWLFVVVLVIIVYTAATWSMTVAGLLLILFAALITDMFLFGRPIASERPSAPDVAPSTPPRAFAPGAPLSSVSLAQPVYQMFQSDLEPSAGQPAPF
jgi:hypothetical protein